MKTNIHSNCALRSIEMKGICVTSGEDVLLENVNLTLDRKSVV